MHRRHLDDRPGEHAHHLPQFLVVQIGYATLYYCTFGIASGTDKPQPDNRLVSLVRIQQRQGELGGLTKAYWQQTGGQRVERSGMSRLAPAKQMSHTLQSGIGSQAGRLVE